MVFPVLVADLLLLDRSDGRGIVMQRETVHVLAALAIVHFRSSCNHHRSRRTRSGKRCCRNNFDERVVAFKPSSACHSGCMLPPQTPVLVAHGEEGPSTVFAPVLRRRLAMGDGIARHVFNPPITSAPCAANAAQMTRFDPACSHKSRNPRAVSK